MEKIYNSIKEDIKNHPEVKSSLLGMVGEWKRSQFVILAEIISKNLQQSLTDDRRLSLGTTISAITLQRFYENEYQIKTHNDLRFIKTLDKLCIFLGKTNLNDYIHQNFQQEDILKPTKEINNHLSDKELITKFCEFQFEALNYLPSVNLEKLSTTLCKDSPLLQRTAQYLEEKSKNNLTFVNDNNRSNYEIFQITMVSDDSELKVLKTKEFWNLVFKDDQENSYIVHHLNTQFYFIKNLDDQWKIWDNFNPDYNNILKIN
ncbi:hypothetical protein Q73A0000_08920 [Kaistella flava (ex Peng et al. 2021)]|uniref:Uncharacterized protein n=1 Tax=Kaistella flava (ex Peng et al. 2021) TaxID=2038776 RepID=A0A7M2Y888_9FLAO|nr:hypothetical protein [Kaistella flava (ex Peng et al. 2021)]QOW10478.1 hypothetical protein Q73A0000_08920 [Kaistella flava (ex Peng et al. 2021)]